MNKDFKQLRRVLDGDDPFMVGGHQKSQLQRRERTVPEWTRSDQKVGKILLRSFPKLHTNTKQRERAAEWARIIHLYFRLQFTYRQTAEEIGKSPGNIRRKIESIKRAGQGLRTNGTGKLRGLKGRPKKSVSV